jgi:hypothetical protein
VANHLGDESRCVYVSLDLVSPEQARVKVYASHTGATAEQLAEGMQRAGGVVPDARGLVKTLTGSHGPFNSRPILTCYAFRATGEPPEVTLHIPVRSYVANDREALDRVCNLLRTDDAERLRETVGSLSERSLDAMRGLLSYVSVRREPAGQCVTVYLSPELYATSRTRQSSVPPGSPDSPKFSLIRDLRPANRDVVTMADVQTSVFQQQQRLASHPLLRRLDGAASRDQIVIVAQRLAFFVMCFRDAARWMRKSIMDPELQQLAETHGPEDNEQRHLNDLARLGISCDVAWLFSTAHDRMRDIAYSQILALRRSTDDRARFAVALSLESAEREIFGKIITALERIGQADGAGSLGKDQQPLPRTQPPFEEGIGEALGRIVIPSNVCDDVVYVVERTFASVALLADELELAAAESHGSDCQPESIGPLVA